MQGPYTNVGVRETFVDVLGLGLVEVQSNTVGGLLKRLKERLGIFKRLTDQCDIVSKVSARKMNSRMRRALLSSYPFVLILSTDMRRI